MPPVPDAPPGGENIFFSLCVVGYDASAYSSRPVQRAVEGAVDDFIGLNTGVRMLSANTTDLASPAVAATLDLFTLAPTAGTSDAIGAQLFDLGYNASSSAAAQFATQLRAATGLSRISSAYLRSIPGVSIDTLQAANAAQPPSPPNPPPRPPWPPAASAPPGALGGRGGAKSRLRVAPDSAGAEVGYAIAGVAALWIIVHTVAHALIAAHRRRTCVTVAVVLQCTTAAQLHADEKHDDDVHGVHVSNADAGSLSMAGKRFKAPLAASLLSAFLAQEAASANAADMLPPPRHVALRPLQRTPLVRAAAAKHEHKAGALALRKKPSNVFWRLKRFILTELRWQAREFRTVARFLRRCCGGSRDAVGKVFRLVPCAGAAVQQAAADGADPAHALARQLAQREGGAATTVLFEASFHFGVAGRDAAAVWRQRLRTESQLLDLEAALVDALRTGELRVSSKEASAASRAGDAANDEPTELKRVGVAAITLLDDEPHANLDKKRAITGRFAQAPEKADAPEEHASDAAARSFGLAPAVATRLAAVLLLSLHDDTAAAAAPIDATAAAGAELEEGAHAV